jgi:hypothetical protein
MKMPASPQTPKYYLDHQNDVHHWSIPVQNMGMWDTTKDGIVMLFC